MSNKNEVTTVNQQLPSTNLLEQLGNLSSTGFENVTSNDMAQSIISILQSNSPQCDKKNEAYLANAEEGHFFDSASKECYPKLLVVPIGFSSSFVEWVDRTKGGGFVGRYNENHPRVREAVQVGNKLVFDNGNNLKETKEHHILILPPNGGLPKLAVLPLSVTQIKHSRRWVSEMSSKVVDLPDGSMKKLPMFFQTYELATGVESNAKGAWYGLTQITYKGMVADHLIETVKEMAETFTKATEGGRKSTAFESQHQKQESQAVVDISSSME